MEYQTIDETVGQQRQLDTVKESLRNLRKYGFSTGQAGELLRQLRDDSQYAMQYLNFGIENSSPVIVNPASLQSLHEDNAVYTNRFGVFDGEAKPYVNDEPVPADPRIQRDYE